MERAQLLPHFSNGIFFLGQRHHVTSRLFDLGRAIRWWLLVSLTGGSWMGIIFIHSSKCFQNGVSERVLVWGREGGRQGAREWTSYLLCILCFLLCRRSLVRLQSRCGSDCIITSSWPRVPIFCGKFGAAETKYEEFCTLFSFFSSLYLTLVLVVFLFFCGVSWLIWCAILIAERKQGEEEQDVESEKMFMLCCERRR